MSSSQCPLATTLLAQMAWCVLRSMLHACSDNVCHPPVAPVQRLLHTWHSRRRVSCPAATDAASLQAASLCLLPHSTAPAGHAAADVCKQQQHHAHGHADRTGRCCADAQRAAAPVPAIRLSFTCCALRVGWARPRGRLRVACPGTRRAPTSPTAAHSVKR